MRSVRYGAALAVLLGAAVAWAAPPVELPPEVKGDVGAFVVVRGKTPGDKVVFVPLDPGLNVFPADLLADKKATVVTAAKPGRYRVLAYSAISGDPTDPAVTTVVIGAAPPVPPGPDPGPGPTPDPKPPGPVTSFRVLLVYESAQLLTPQQSAVVYGKAVADYLNAKCTKDGTNPSWRRYDKDADASTEAPNVKALWEAVKPKVTTVPCVVIEVNGTATIEPLPASIDAALTLLKKYRGE